MFFRLQPAGVQADPHDAIAAQLRDLAPRIKNEPSQTKGTSPSTETSQPVGESSFQAAPPNDNADALLKTIPRARSRRGILKVLLAISVGVAVTTAWHSYGEEAKQTLSRLVPQLLTAAPASIQDATADKPQDTAAQAAAAEPTAEAEPAQKAVTAAPEPPAPSTDPVTTSTQAPPTQAALPAETAQLLETMASDIAALKHAVDELRASEQQLRRETAMIAEREPHPKPVQRRGKSAPPRRQPASPQAIPYNSPAPPPSLPRATERQIHPQESIQRDAYIPSQAPVPARLPPQPGDDSTPRPPMPLR
jgi:uncharacterized phage infection (PIP) family protein YhgE